MGPQKATVWPISFAVGVAVLLVGLIVSPEVLTPLGAAIAALAGLGWVRGGRAPQPASRTEDRRPQAAPPQGEEDRLQKLVRHRLALRQIPRLDEPVRPQPRRARYRRGG